MNRGTVLLILAAIVCVVGVGRLLNGEGSDGEPLRTAEELSVLPDDRLEAAVLYELGRDIYREDVSPGAWRRMRTKARHLWSVAAIKDLDPVAGLAGWLRTCRSGATTPGPQDMQDGLAAMGLDRAALIMERIGRTEETVDAGTLFGLQRQLGETMRDRTVQTARQAWVRDNLHEMLGR